MPNMNKIFAMFVGLSQSVWYLGIRQLFTESARGRCIRGQRRFRNAIKLWSYQSSTHLDLLVGLTLDPEVYLLLKREFKLFLKRWLIRNWAGWILSKKSHNSKFCQGLIGELKLLTWRSKFWSKYAVKFSVWSPLGIHQSYTFRQKHLADGGMRAGLAVSGSRTSYENCPKGHQNMY